MLLCYYVKVIMRTHSRNFLQFFPALPSYFDCFQLLKELFSQVCVGISLGLLFKTQLEQVLLHKITVLQKVKDSTRVNNK